jgi:hypothetical protein
VSIILATPALLKLLAGAGVVGAVAWAVHAMRPSR